MDPLGGVAGHKTGDYSTTGNPLRRGNYLATKGGPKYYTYIFKPLYKRQKWLVLYSEVLLHSHTCCNMLCSAITEDATHQYCFMTLSTDHSDPVSADWTHTDSAHPNRSLAIE